MLAVSSARTAGLDHISGVRMSPRSEKVLGNATSSVRRPPRVSLRSLSLWSGPASSGLPCLTRTNVLTIRVPPKPPFRTSKVSNT